MYLTTKGGEYMRLKSMADAEAFMKVIQSCEGPVYLTDSEVDENGKYNLRLNLKSTLSMFFGVSKLLEEHGDWFEIHTMNYNDECRVMGFIMELEANERKENLQGNS